LTVFVASGNMGMMDTSEQYIKMCEKAEEIQERKPFDCMSWYLNKSLEGDEVCEGRNLISVACSIWLPRQDQLQEMVGDYRQCSQFLAEYFSAMLDWLPFLGQERDEYWDSDLSPIKFTSMEQLWLAFVMKEKFGKIWNGGEWVRDGRVK